VSKFEQNVSKQTHTLVSKTIVAYVQLNLK